MFSQLVRPRGCADDVVKTQLRRRKAVPAILASIFVAQKKCWRRLNLTTFFGNRSYRNSRINPRNLNLEIDRPDPVLHAPAGPPPSP